MIRLAVPWPNSMQSFREQSSYHGTPQSYPQDVHGSSRLEEFSPRQQAPMFQGSFANSRGGTAGGSPAPQPSSMAGESPVHQAYQAYRKEASELYCLANKETSPGQRATPSTRAAPGGRRPSGPVQSYGPPQGSASFGSQYASEAAHHGQFSTQHSALSGVSQYPQDYSGSFSPGGTQYQPSSASQQHRQQIYQSHQPLQHTTGQPATSAAAHQQQMQRALAASSAGYQLRVGQFGQHYQTANPSSSSSSSFPPAQRFGQSGQSYDGYSAVNTGSQYDGHMVGTNAQAYSGTQSGYTYQSQQIKGFEQSKMPQAGGGGSGGSSGGGGQQLTPPGQPPTTTHHMQYPNSTKMTVQGQTSQYSQAEAPARSPMQFQQNFSPISNPSPAPSVTQSPSCSSTPSPLMPGSGEGAPGGASGSNTAMPLSSRNRILHMMPQLSPTPSMITSPNTHGGSGYKNFSMEGLQEKRLTDPGLSSLSALSSQVANLPNTVQHMLLSDALAPHKNRGKRSTKKTDSGSNSEASSQAGDQQTKSPLAESPDGGSSSSSEDQADRVRQLSGQSTGSEATYKEPSYKDSSYKDPPYNEPTPEKPCSPPPATRDPQTESTKEETGPAETEETAEADEPPKATEKVVGVIVSREAMASRTEKETEEEEEDEEEDEDEEDEEEEVEEEDGGSSPEHNEDPPQPQTPPSPVKGAKEPSLPSTPYSEPSQGAAKMTKIAESSTHHNGEESSQSGPAIPVTSGGEKTEPSRSPVNLGYPYKDNLTVSASIHRNAAGFQQYPKSQEKGDSPGPAEKKGAGHARNEKFPSLLQEVLQGYHHQERRYARNAQDNPALAGILEGAVRSNLLMAQAGELPGRNVLGKNVSSLLDNPHWGPWERKSTGGVPEAKQINLAEYAMTRKFELESQATSHDGNLSERRSVICDISPLRQLMRDPASHLHHHPPIGHVGASPQERITDSRIARGDRAPPGIGQSVILPGGHDPKQLKENEFELTKAPTGLNHRKPTESTHPFSTKHDLPRANARAPSHGPTTEFSHQESRPTHTRRGAGRMGGRGKSSTQAHEFGEKIRPSPGRSRGTVESHHVVPQMSLADRASREAFYSAFFQNSESQALASAYHANARSSNYGEPHQSLNAPLHYKRQMYQQQEEFKDWANSAQAILSAQHRQEQVQRKSPRQEPMHGRVRSPYRSEKEGPPYNHPMPYHDITGVQEHSRSHKLAEGLPPGVSLEMKQNSQRTQPVESGWNLSQQVSPSKKTALPSAANQKRFSPQWEMDGHTPRPDETTVSPKLGNALLRLPGQEESHQNPLIMRRRVRSFISPIPSKRHPQDSKPADDKARTTAAPARHDAEQPFNCYSRFPQSREGDISPARGDPTRNTAGSELRGSPALSLSSQAKTKILPPRKGRGLKLEAIVQKITSPSIRRCTGAPNSAECGVDAVTLDDILSLKSRLSDAVVGEVQEVRKVEAMPQAMTRMAEPEEPENLVVKCDIPLMKPLDVWRSPAEEEVKEEALELPSIGIEPIGPMAAPTLQTLESNLDRPDASPNGSEPRIYLDLKSVSPARVPPPEPVIEVLEKERVLPCVTPKPDPFPPKGYFPSGKKKGRPIGSVNKQKKQQQQKQPRKQQATSQPPPLPSLVTEQPLPVEIVEGEPKPKRQRRERRKPVGPPRRRRTKQAIPIVEPEEPEIKLKYAIQPAEKVEVRSKTFIPYIHVEGQNELGASCTVINAEEEEQSKLAAQLRKMQRPLTPQPEVVEGKALPSSTFLQHGPVVTESSVIGRLVCCLCGKWANYKYLGDLFGPFYTQEYAAGLPKIAPPKRSSETLSKLKVRHKSNADGSKSDSEEEEIEEKTKEQRSLTTHPRFKRRNRVEAAAKNTDSSQVGHTDLKVPLEVVPEPEVQIPELPLDSNEYWVHEGCALWASGVFYVCGRLYGLQEALEITQEMKCTQCQEPGASLGCYNRGCLSQYHHLCAMEADCLLNEEDFSVWCPKHKTQTVMGVVAEQSEQG
ncbi:transcription factor 20 isoform X2 [Ambystoma mexicanum]|uniref:transcription factor 20 isoform X2 n=1 Tax=Ambystoma mexicanum TaxID=8296 RepID=UPI0037E7C2E2